MIIGAALAVALLALVVLLVRRARRRRRAEEVARKLEKLFAPAIEERLFRPDPVLRAFRVEPARRDGHSKHAKTLFARDRARAAARAVEARRAASLAGSSSRRAKR